MSRRKHIAIFMLFVPFTSRAQHTTIHTNVLWAGYGSTFRFSKKWTLMTDAQMRTVQWTDKWLLYGFRAGLAYDLGHNFAVASGLTLFESAQYYRDSYFFKNEWRPWEEISYQIKFNKINLLQRLRTEQRFLQQVVNNQKSKNYQYILRLRYRFEWQFPLKKDNIKLLAGNEIFVNPGELNNQSFFDQNRTFAGFGVKLSANSTLQATYIKIYQWRSSTSVLEDQNAIRLNVYQQFNARKLNRSHKTA